MCRLLGVIGKPPLPLKPALDSFYPLCTNGRVKCTMTPGHQDGWGVSGYSAGRAVYFERRAESAADGQALFNEATEKAVRSQTPVLIAHLRKASEGRRDVSNTHPFHSRDWVFAHNGTIFGAQASFPLMDSQPQGDTDSERFMLWLLERVANVLDPTAGLVQVLKENRETLVFSSLTFLLTNGKTLWAYRDYGNKRLEAGETTEEREKYYTLYTARLDNAAVVCSEPLTAVSKSWQPMKQRTLAVFTPETLVPKIFSI